MWKVRGNTRFHNYLCSITLYFFKREHRTQWSLSKSVLFRFFFNRLNRGLFCIYGDISYPQIIDRNPLWHQETNNITLSISNAGMQSCYSIKYSIRVQWQKAVDMRYKIKKQLKLPLVFKAYLRWLDTVFQGQCLLSLSINYVAINKVFEKLPPQLY